jgi:hypothetical protein
MIAVPLHIKRQFEQRWASRFTASSSPETKSPATTESNVGAGRKGPKKGRPVRRRAGTVHGAGG